MPDKKKTFKLVIVFIGAIVLFQSTISTLQYVKKGYIGSSIESEGYISSGSSVDEDAYQFRPLGTFPHPNYLAQFLVIVLPLFLSLLYLPSKKNRLFLSLIFCLGLINLVLTQSRSSWLVFTASILTLLFVIEKKMRLRLILFPREKRVLFFLFIALLFVSFVVLPDRIRLSVYSFEEQAGVTTRIELMENWIKLIIQHPLLGVGQGMSVTEAFFQDSSGILSYFPEAVHNVYLIIASESGLIGSLFYVIYLFIVLRSLLITSEKHTTNQSSNIETKLQQLGIASGMMATMANFLFQPYGTTIEYVIILSSLLLY